MRVIHLAASFPRTADDPTAPFLLDLVRLQRDAGWDVSVITTHDAGLPTSHEVEGIPVRRVRYAPQRWEVLGYRGGGHGTLRSPGHALLLPGLLVAMRSVLAREVRRRRPDAIHAHWMLPAGLVAIAVRRGKARVVVSSHGSDVAFAKNRIARMLCRPVLRRADAVLADSEANVRHAYSVFGDSAPITVAPLPLPADLVPTPIPSGPRRLLAAGRAAPEKGFDVLLEALQRPETAQWSLTLVTDGPEAADLRRRAAKLGSRVDMRPMLPRAELMALMPEHHAVVVPSRREGLGMFALEAIAAGRQVIASNVGGLPETVVDPRDGALVPPDDPKALATAIARLTPEVPPGQALIKYRAPAVLAVHLAAYRGDEGTTA